MKDKAEEIELIFRENCCEHDNDHDRCCFSQSVLNEMAKEISQLNNKDEWISVEDRLPVLEDEIMWKRFWCYYKLHNTNRSTQGLMIFERMPDDTFRWANSNVTHWMSLPQPPETKEGE